MASRRKKSEGRPISLVHVSDVHLGSGEGHGRINKETGLNVRFEDFGRAFACSVDFALSNSVDVFLFSGDAYRNASPEPVYQKAFAEQLRRLSAAGIPTVLLVGNHDQILRSSDSHSMSVFQSLAVPHVTTIDTPRLLRVDTEAGACQIIGLPHVTRNIVMAQPQYAAMSAADIDSVVVNHVRLLLADFYEQLDAKLPAVVTAHMMVDRARAGAEQELMVGYAMTFPTDIFIDERVDYVALGHVHGHQVLRKSAPAIVYAGSIERVDFSEEAEDKGFVHVLLSRGGTTYQFHSVDPRPFVTVDVDVTESAEPLTHILEAIARKIKSGCVLRVRFRIRQAQLELLDEAALRRACEPALSVQLKPEVLVSQREFRMPDLTESSVETPMAALERYLDQMAPERKDVLLERARALAARLEQDG